MKGRNFFVAAAGGHRCDLRSNKRLGSWMPLAVVVACVVSLAVVGCDYESTRQPVGKGKGGVSTAQNQYRADVLRSAISMLNAPERFDNEDEASNQIVDQLIQWIRMVREAKGATSEDAGEESAVIAVDWTRDPLVDGLPEALQRSRLVRTLAKESFDSDYDGMFLREVALLRDVTHSIEPAKLDDLSVGEAYFDWVVRNVQIERMPLPEDVTPADKWLDLHVPLETLYFGRGTPLGRAWLFIVLARQMDLNAVLLAVPDSRNPDQPRPWAIGLVSGDDIYLFDYTYGLPIPGPNGEGIATLAQAAEDDSILRQMDIPGGRAYPRKAKDLEKTIVLLEGSPGYLSRRMKLLETHLTGKDRMTLTASPSALAEKVKGMKHVADVRLWTMPYQILAERQSITAAAADELSPARPTAMAILRERQLERLPFELPLAPEQKKTSQDNSQQDLRPESREELRRRGRNILALRLGRLLHLRGEYGGVDPNADRGRTEEEVSEIVERGAKSYYLRAKLTKQELDDIDRLLREGFEITPGRRLAPEQVKAMHQMRDDATYWLGLIWFASGGYQAAEQFLLPMTEAKSDNVWANGANFNLARCYEALGKYPESIKLYEADKSPQQYGSRLRAERLKGKEAK